MKKLIPALCALALILSSCSPGRDVTAAEDPRHPYIEEEACPLREGESLSFDPCEVTLFYPGESGPALGTAVCTVSVSEDVSLPAACINYLLSAYAGFPAGTRLTALYVCSGTALVCLSADALAFSGGHEGASLVYSVADTLLSLDGISRVAVTAGGRLLSPGVISSVVTDTHAVPAGADVRLSFRAAGGYLEPVALKGEALSLPGGITAEISDPFVTSGGYTAAALHIRGGDIDPLEMAGLALTALFSSPGIDRVILTVNDSIMPSLSCPSGLIGSENGLFDADSLLTLTGSSVTVYIPENGKLVPLQEVCARAVSRSPLLTLRLLLEKLASAGILPELRGTDALSCRLSGKVLSVNLSAELYAACQVLTSEQERLFAYSIVNTLTSFTGVRGVRLYIDGGQADTLVHAIYLKTTLIANPGLISG